MNEPNLKKIQQPRRNSINQHLIILGAGNYLDGPISIPGGGKARAKLRGTSNDTIETRFEAWEILWAAKQGHKDRMQRYHPDKKNGDTESAKVLNASIDWVKKWAKRRGCREY